MTDTVLITLSCPDRPGLVSAVAGALFDLGGNLGDTTFAVLGELAELKAICELPADTTAADVAAELERLPETRDGRLSVTPFSMAAIHGPTARITHRIMVSGGDRPGLIARLAEVFAQYRANIVRLNSERVPDGSTMRYVVRIAVNIPEDTADSCLATVANTAGELSLSCSWDRV